MLAQIIDVPVRFEGKFQMMPDPAAQPAGTHGAADIDIIPWAEDVATKSTHSDMSRLKEGKQQGVCACGSE